jgi:ABC-type bacteriocin/lantibiotic exporter with double-glycine peptidase domain
MDRRDPPRAKNDAGAAKLSRRGLVQAMLAAAVVGNTAVLSRAARALAGGLLQVPYAAQIDPNSCGAAVLEMIYRYYRISPVDQNDIFNAYKELEPHGSGNFRMSTDSLVRDARRHGLDAGWERANFRSTQDSIAQLRLWVEERRVPLIVCQKFTDRSPLIGHFRIVLGLDRGDIVLHDPSPEVGGAALRWPEAKFMDYWQPTGENVTGGVYIWSRLK